MPAPVVAAALPSLGNIASAGLSFLGDVAGSLFGDDEDINPYQVMGFQENMARADRAFQAEWAQKSLDFQDKWAAASMAAQKEAAQNAILWRMQDAKRAGIHPIYAMGSQGISMSPVSVGGAQVGGSGTGSPPMANPESTIGREMGQNLGRAMSAMFTKEERVANKVNEYMDLRYKQLQIENMGLEGDLLRSQITSINRQQEGPPKPSTSREKTVLVEPQPARPVVSAAEGGGREAGTIQDYGFVRTKDGLAVVPSNDMKQRMDDNFIQQVLWEIRNTASNILNGPTKAPRTQEYPLKKGEGWKWNFWRQQYQPYNSETNTYRRY